MAFETGEVSQFPRAFIPCCLSQEGLFFVCSGLVTLRLPHWFSGKESVCNAGDTGLIPESGRSPGEGNGNPLQYSCLKKKKSHEQRSLAGYSLWGHKESDMTEHSTSPANFNMKALEQNDVSQREMKERLYQENLF